MAEETQEKKDWADARLRSILTRAKTRVVVWREIDLSQYDPELEGQRIPIWANAPSAVMDFMRNVDWTSDAFYDGLAELSQYPRESWIDLLDAWDSALRSWVVRMIFNVLSEYRDERFNFLVMPPPDGETTNSKILVTPKP